VIVDQYSSNPSRKLSFAFIIDFVGDREKDFIDLVDMLGVSFVDDVHEFVEVFVVFQGKVAALVAEVYQQADHRFEQTLHFLFLLRRQLAVD
jgi:hypothetical protein